MHTLSPGPASGALIKRQHDGRISEANCNCSAKDRSDTAETDVDAGPHGGLLGDPDQSWRNLNTGRLLHASFVRYETEVLRVLHAAGYGDIRRTHFNVLRHVDAKGTRMAELAARANLTKAAMTFLVRTCEAIDLVTTTSDPNDGRARVVRYASKGEEVMLLLRNTMINMEQTFRERLGVGSYEVLRAALLELSEMSEVVSFKTSRRHGLPNADKVTEGISVVLKPS